jgi:hypothetical protein
MNPALIFHVETITPLASHDHNVDESWCSYVVANGRSRVEGRFRGTPAQARRNAEQLASSFNERAQSGKAPGTMQRQTKRRPRFPKGTIAPAAKAGAVGC